MEYEEAEENNQQVPGEIESIEIEAGLVTG